MTDRPGPLRAKCRNPACPSKQIVEGLGEAFLRPAKEVLSTPDRHGIWRCGWCDKAVELTEPEAPRE